MALSKLVKSKRVAVEKRVTRNTSSVSEWSSNYVTFVYTFVDGCKTSTFLSHLLLKTVG